MYMADGIDKQQRAKRGHDIHSRGTYQLGSRIAEKNLGESTAKVVTCFRYYFPTYENDRLLCYLDEMEESSKKGAAAASSEVEVIEEVTDAVIIAEDLNIEEAMGRREYIMKELRS